MSKDIIVLTPNGRRQKVHCTPDTSILQVLEDVCSKQGFQAEEYDLKHHNHILDLTTTIRFSNLPNKACLEMVEVERKRSETNVTVALTLNDGERRTADFPPQTSLYELVSSLALKELRALENPAIVYMRQEVVGAAAMQDKTLRQLGLLTGRAVMRLINKAETQTQANVSAVYRAKPQPQEEHNKPVQEPPQEDHNKPAQESQQSTSKYVGFDPIAIIKQKLHWQTTSTPDQLKIKDSEHEPSSKAEELTSEVVAPAEEVKRMDIDKVPANLGKSTDSDTSLSRENLERRLMIEEEVTFLGTQKAIAFMQPVDSKDDVQDLPDDFYDLTIEEVRRLYHDLQKERTELENAPLITSAQKEIMEKQASEQILNTYKNAVVRIQFPDHMILQGVFSPQDTIQHVINFIKQHLETPAKPFHIYTTPLKEALDPKQTLLEARFVPCVHMHFRWRDEEAAGGTDAPHRCLKPDVYRRQTPSDAASILASKYRAPSRRKVEGTSSSSQKPSTSSTNKSKVPKWFK